MTSLESYTTIDKGSRPSVTESSNPAEYHWMNNTQEEDREVGRDGSSFLPYATLHTRFELDKESTGTGQTLMSEVNIVYPTLNPNVPSPNQADRQRYRRIQLRSRLDENGRRTRQFDVTGNLSKSDLDELAVHNDTDERLTGFHKSSLNDPSAPGAETSKASLTFDSDSVDVSSGPNQSALQKWETAAREPGLKGTCDLAKEIADLTPNSESPPSVHAICTSGYVSEQDFRAALKDAPGLLQELQLTGRYNVLMDETRRGIGFVRDRTSASGRETPGLQHGIGQKYYPVRSPYRWAPKGTV
jgi:hypothetical protein